MFLKNIAESVCEYI